MDHLELIALVGVLIGLTAVAPNIVDGKAGKALPAAVGLVVLGIAGALAM